MSDDAAERAKEIAHGDGWSHKDYIWDGENEVPETRLDRGTLAELIADAIRAAVKAAVERCADVAAEAMATVELDHDGSAAEWMRNRVMQGAPQWSSEPPTVPGWYWFRDGAGVRAVEVQRAGERGERPVLLVRSPDAFVWLSAVTGGWCPVQEPPG